MIGFRNGDKNFTMSQEGSGSRDPLRDTRMKFTSSQIFKPGKVNWKNLANGSEILD